MLELEGISSFNDEIDIVLVSKQTLRGLGTTKHIYNGGNTVWYLKETDKETFDTCLTLLEEGFERAREQKSLRQLRVATRLQATIQVMKAADIEGMEQKVKDIANNKEESEGVRVLKVAEVIRDELKTQYKVGDPQQRNENGPREVSLKRVFTALMQTGLNMRRIKMVEEERGPNEDSDESDEEGEYTIYIAQIAQVVAMLVAYMSESSQEEETEQSQDGPRSQVCDEQGNVQDSKGSIIPEVSGEVEKESVKMRQDFNKMRQDFDDVLIDGQNQSYQSQQQRPKQNDEIRQLKVELLEQELSERKAMRKREQKVARKSIGESKEREREEPSQRPVTRSMTRKQE